MKTGTITFNYFEKGDRVITPLGEGTVVKDEELIFNDRDLYESEVLILHDSGCSENTSNSEILIGRYLVSKLSIKDSYTRKEVVEFAYKLLKATGSEIRAEMVDMRHIIFSGVDNWLDNNL